MENSTLIKKIKEVWLKDQMLHTCLGVLTLFKTSIIALALCVIVDYAFALPSNLRAALFIAVLALALVKAWTLAWNKLKGFDARHNALKIEEHFGNLESILVTAIQLRDRNDNSVSESLTNMTCKKADEKVSKLPCKEAVSMSPLKQPALIMAGLLAGIIVISVMNPVLMKTAFGRFMPPWQDIRYPTQTQLELAQGDITVKEGAPVEISAKVGGVIPEHASIAIRTGQNKARDNKLDIKEQTCKYNIKTAFRSFEYRISAGDDQSQWHKVKVISSPKIKKAIASIEYPEYTKKEKTSSESLTLSMPENSTVYWELTLDRAVSSAILHCEGSEDVKMEIYENGDTVRGQFKVKSSRAYHFTWKEKSKGYEFKSPKYFLQVTPDKAPKVEIVTPGEDLYAIIGRKLDLSFLVRDDFGLSEANIIYRHNNGVEKKQKIPVEQIKLDQVYQSQWDYRKYVKNLKVGDIIRVGVEVKDHFPSTSGPNTTRSRMMRITFLTKEDYLKNLHKRTRRLLSKLRSIYRQSRESYEVVSNINMKSESFRQSCMLEGVRQNLIGERIQGVSERIHMLIEDIKANKIEATVQLSDLQSTLHQLKFIDTKYVKEASNQLRALAESELSNEIDNSAAAEIINTSSRHIASLVLQLGVSYATEVLARELNTAIQTQTYLHRMSLDKEAQNHPGLAKTMSIQQKKLSEYLLKLINELQDNPDYTGSAMAALKLSRMTKHLRDEKITERMLAISDFFKKSQYEKTILEQENILQTLKATVYKLKARSELQALIKARNTIQTIVLEEGLSIEQQLNQMKTVILPNIPMPKQAMVSIETPLDIKPREVLKETLEHLSSKDSNQQVKAKVKMKTLVDLINHRIQEMSQFGESFAMLMGIETRFIKLKDFISRQSSLLEQTEDALDDEASVAALEEQQNVLRNEVDSLIKQIETVIQGSDFSGYAPALIDPLKAASTSMIESAVLMKNDTADDFEKKEESIEKQESAVASLKITQGILNSEYSTLAKVAKASQYKTSIGLIGEYFTDIEGELSDIVKATAKASPKQMKRLIEDQKNLAKCLDDVMSALTGPVDTNDMQSLLEFSQSSFGSAALLMKENKKQEAAKFQNEAGDLLRETRDDVVTIAKRNAYVAEMIDFIYRKSVESVNIQAMQKQLNYEVKYNEDLALNEIIKRQEQCYKQAIDFGEDMHQVTKQGHFKLSSKFMANAIRLLKENKKDQARQDMVRAAGAVLVDNDEFNKLIKNLAEVPAAETRKWVYQEVIEMLEVLDYSLVQQDLTRKLWMSSGKAKEEAVSQQKQHAAKLKELFNKVEDHPFLASAHQHLEKAISELSKSQKGKAYQEQREAESYLRGFVLEYAYAFIKFGMGNGKKKSPYADPFKEDVEVSEFEQLDKFDVFQKMAVAGDLPEDEHSEWEVLGKRERAALNENFARELPLEYRDLLKNYYERLAQ